MKTNALRDYYLSLEEQGGINRKIGIELNDEDYECSKEEYIYCSTVHEELLLTFEGLEEIIYSIESALDQEHRDPLTVQLAHLSVESYACRMGINGYDILPLITTEASAQDTKLSIKKGKGFLAKTWEKIKALFEKVLNAITGFFSKWFTGLRSLKRYNEKLRAKSKTLKDKIIDPARQVRIPDTLRYKGKATENAVKEGLKECFNVYGYLNYNYIPQITRVYNDAAEEILEVGGKKEGAEKLIKVIKGTKVLWVFKGFPSVNYTLPGNRTLKADAGYIPFFETQPIKPGDIIGDNNVQTKNLSIDYYLNTVDDLIKEGEKCNKRAQDFIKKVVIERKKVDGFFSNVKFDINHDRKLKLSRLFQKNLMHNVILFCNYTYKIAKALLIFIDNAMYQYESKEKERKPKDRREPKLLTGANLKGID